MEFQAVNVVEIDPNDVANSRSIGVVVWNDEQVKFSQHPTASEAGAVLFVEWVLAPGRPLGERIEYLLTRSNGVTWDVSKPITINANNLSSAVAKAKAKFGE